MAATQLRSLLRGLALPDVPREVREDYVVEAAKQVQKQSRWLFAVLGLTTPIAIWSASNSASWLVQWGLPLTMGLYCLFGFFALQRNFEFETHPQRAERFCVEVATSSVFGAMVCSLWCVLSWLSIPDSSVRLHFPLILVMGALATAHCLARVRLGAAVHLVVDIVPISLLLLTSGLPMDFFAGVSLMLCGLFQWHMIEVHNRHLIEMLTIKRQSQYLAQTDPLTGLLNRRALLDFAEALGDSDEHSRMMLIDVDHFKAINDRYGHDMGDAVLAEIARLLDARAGNNVSAARMGGEEFALLGSLEALPEATALALISEFRSHVMPHGDRVTISIGIAEGPLADGGDWRELYSRADRALYAAKHAGRNRYCHIDDVEDGAMPGTHAARPGVATATG